MSLGCRLDFYSVIERMEVLRISYWREFDGNSKVVLNVRAFLATENSFAIYQESVFRGIFEDFTLIKTPISS